MISQFPCCPVVSYPHAASNNECRNKLCFAGKKTLLTKGDVVVHKKFGIGTVKDFADMGDNSVVTVGFNNGQTKTLMLQYAKLVKI